jgi:hypothetical protein
LIGKNPDKESADFYVNLMIFYLDNKLFDLEQLTKRGQNPLTNFIFDCEETEILHSDLARQYITDLIKRGDNKLPNDVSDILNRCSSQAK